MERLRSDHVDGNLHPNIKERKLKITHLLSHTYLPIIDPQGTRKTTFHMNW